MDKENEYDQTENGYERTEDDYSQSEDNYTRPEKDFTRKEKDFIRLPVNSDDELPQKPQRRSLWRVSKELVLNGTGQYENNLTQTMLNSC